MQDFFIKFDIPDLELIQQELISTIKHDFLSRPDTHSWIGLPNLILPKCPTLKNFLEARCKSKIFQIKFYCTPPNNSLHPHVDGSEVKIPFGMNIPLLNTKGTFQRWFDCPASNIEKRKTADKSLYPNGYWADVDVPIDATNMSVIKELELDTPAFTKTDTMHDVVNPTNLTRLIAVFRWNIWKPTYSEPTDVFEFNGLNILT